MLKSIALLSLACLILLSGCRKDLRQEDKNRFMAPKDTPIIVSGGSMTLDSSVPWFEISSGKKDKYQSSYDGLVASILITDRDGTNLQQTTALGDKTWEMHLTTVAGSDVSIKGVPSGPPGQRVTKVVAAAWNGAEWSPDDGAFYSIDLVADEPTKIDKITIKVNESKVLDKFPCKPQSSTDNRQKGRCRITFAK